MKHNRAMALALGLALMLPVAAWAQTAYTNRSVNMRAGPNQEFPRVMLLPAGAAVFVHGCIDGYTWCDVTAGPERGWIYADYLSYPYQNQPVTVISGGALLGLPLITFSIGSYWDSYYRNRPWYGSRSTWYDRSPNWWYRAPPQRAHRPVVRPYPQYRGDRQYSDRDRRPQQYSQPRQTVRPRTERPATGEMDRSSKSERTYTQQ
ncbi:hypothetical protein BURK1_03167 [Burkholderiales bacterium]|nr:hypothetical protein BURK1_03167 [Burkholderiales bacterium]